MTIADVGSAYSSLKAAMRKFETEYETLWQFGGGRKIRRRDLLDGIIRSAQELKGLLEADDPITAQDIKEYEEDW